MEFENKLKTYCESRDFSGVVSINKNGEGILSKSFGYRDVTNKLANNVNTSFGIASGTKTFTALGIIKLIEQGALSFSTPIHDFFEGNVSFIHANATIKNVLCHNSGIYDYYDEELITDFDNFEVDIPWFKLEKPSDYYPLFESENYKFEPGQRFSYSNGGYILLGIIIENSLNNNSDSLLAKTY